MGDPPWTNKDIKELIHNKNHTYVYYHQNKNNLFSFHKFQISSVKAKACVNFFRISLKIWKMFFISPKILVLLSRDEKFCKF